MAPASIVALIPARSGSRRIPGKNVKRLQGHPLIAYTIAAARGAGIFDRILVSTDCPDYAQVARHYGAEVPFLRPREFSGDESPDIEWLDHLLRTLSAGGTAPDCFCILRPTSPFRLASTIRRAWKEFSTEQGVDSLRAVERCAQHPGKMWVLRGKRMLPLLPLSPSGQPWHSTPYAALPMVYVQNASLEIAWSRVVLESRTIAGTVVMPFLTTGSEGLDLNAPEDWVLAEHLLREQGVALPEVDREPWQGEVSP